MPYNYSERLEEPLMNSNLKNYLSFHKFKKHTFHINTRVFIVTLSNH